MATESISRHTRVGFADESGFNTGRFRSLAVVTCGRGQVQQLSLDVATMLEDSSVTELKWAALKGARQRFAAEKVVIWTVDAVADRKLTLDVLVWDTHDARHNVRGRDDIANLHRMYYRLLRNACGRSRLHGAIWRLQPDTNGVMDWQAIHDFLHYGALRDLGNERRRSSMRLWRDATRRYMIEAVVPSDSIETPLIQVADLFAGLAAYSHERFPTFQAWRLKEVEKSQLVLQLGQGAPERVLSAADAPRCAVLDLLNRACKQHRLGVSLDRRQGLTNFPPDHGISFWLYEPQHAADRAPIRSSRLL